MKRNVIVFFFTLQIYYNLEKHGWKIISIVFEFVSIQKKEAIMKQKERDGVVILVYDTVS